MYEFRTFMVPANLSAKAVAITDAIGGGRMIIFALVGVIVIFGAIGAVAIEQ